ncbi:MAG: VWA domain-containing protein [Desulfamplus sp.]|nr:VWA domain-containing protein [Desulfamplus sp.]
MGKNLLLRREDLITNPTPRVPVCLVLDCSPSMSGEVAKGAAVEQTSPRPIDELNSGIELFFKSIKEDEVARYSAEVAVVRFSGVAETVLDFDSIGGMEPPVITIDGLRGGTSIGGGVSLALSLLEARKNEYQEAGVDYYQPWIVLMTDGRPTDETHTEVSRRVADMVEKRRLTIFPIGIGRSADMEVLSLFSPRRSPLRLKGLCFSQFFEWLSRSVSVTSQSMPGETIPLDTEGIKGWGEL